MQQEPVGFSITQGKGFHITFQNGYTVSVQWGFWNYCHNTKPLSYNTDEYPWGRDETAETAEVAVWKDDGQLLKLRGWDDTVKGYCTPEEVLKVLNWAASRKTWRGAAK